MPSALIWGITGGIGSALAEELRANGWSVVGIARDAGADATGSTHTATNFADEYQVRQAVLAVSQDETDFDLFVYAAGDITADKVADMRLATWTRILDANLTGPFLTTQQSLPLLAPAATLLYIGAVQEQLRLPGLSAYAAAKAGLEAFVAALSKEERARKVLLIRPGAVDTPLWSKVSMRLPKDAQPPRALAFKIVEALSSSATGTIDL